MRSAGIARRGIRVRTVDVRPDGAALALGISVAATSRSRRQPVRSPPWSGAAQAAPSSSCPQGAYVSERYWSTSHAETCSW